jgi:hypothetical protein
LRREVVEVDRQGERPEGRGALMRCGLATWAQIRLTTALAPSSPALFPSGTPPSVLDIIGSELVRLVAGLILSTRREGLQHG